MNARFAPCANCGDLTALEELDAKPGSGEWTPEQLAEAADAGRQFERLECAKCYGPSFDPL